MKSVIIITLMFCLATAIDLRGRNHLPALREVRPQGRITNGQIAAANQFPYQVGLSLYDGASYTWCGGSLISNQWVLTAAHCTFGIKSANVLLGGLERLNSTVVYTVEQSNIYVHANFKVETVINDIALIRIPAVNFTNAIQPVALPKDASSYPTYVNKTATASGWGLTSDAASTLSAVLLYANFKVISNEECTESYGTDAIYDGKLCTATGNRTATCSGDSGGPLVYSHNGSKVQIGISSFGANEGCEAGFPDAFTRVSFYLDWIKNITRSEAIHK